MDTDRMMKAVKKLLQKSSNKLRNLQKTITRFDYLGFLSVAIEYKYELLLNLRITWSVLTYWLTF